MREATASGLTPTDIVRRALVNYLARLERSREIAAYVREAALGYADPKIRRDALAIAEEAVVAGNKTLVQVEGAETGSGARIVGADVPP